MEQLRFVGIDVRDVTALATPYTLRRIVIQVWTVLKMSNDSGGMICPVLTNPLQDQCV